MSETRFTPGPWEVVPLSGIGGPYSIRMPMPAGSKHPTHYGIRTVGTEANAHLIAAAPEMHDALAPFADIDGEGDEDFPDDTPVTVKFGRTTDYTLTLGDFRRARHVLSKARGERS